MKIGIYGGSFNPVHYGHLGLAKYVLEHTDLDEVWMMVSPNNPLKDSGILADEHVRLAALREALANLPIAPSTSGKLGRVLASDFEFALPRPSYTANTLRELSRVYPQHEFCLVMGEDNWNIFHRWRESDFILSNYRIIVYPRHSASSHRQEDVSCGAYCSSDRKNVLFLPEAPYFDISSTELRSGGRSLTE